MRPRTILGTTLAAVPLALLLATPALACRGPIERHSPAGWAMRAERAIGEAALIVDGEVVSPMDFSDQARRMTSAQVRITRVLKGKPNSMTITVQQGTSCDHQLSVQGERVRLLLVGPDPLHAPRHLNAPFTDRPGLRRFADAVDRAAGHPRPAGTSIFAGAADGGRH